MNAFFSPGDHVWHMRPEDMVDAMLWMIGSCGQRTQLAGNGALDRVEAMSGLAPALAGLSSVSVGCRRERER